MADRGDDVRGDDVLDREEFERRVTKVCAPSSGDPAVVSDAEDRRDTLLAHDAALRERVAELEEVLEGMMDGTDCRLDHHGLCQAHGWGEGGNCPERRARRALDKGENEG